MVREEQQSAPPAFFCPGLTLGWPAECLQRGSGLEREMRIAENGIQDDNIAIGTEGKISARKTVAVMIGVLDKEGLIACDRIVSSDVEPPSRKIVDSLFDNG
jgi:hypothetical protein